MLRFFKKTKRYKNSEITILDRDPNIKIPSGYHSKLGKDYLKNLSTFDIIVRSPGIAYTLPQLYRARCNGSSVASATKFFFWQIENNPGRKPKIIGITGTKGKGTTATILYKILKASGKKVLLAGNIGKPMLDILPQALKANYIVLEISSFQLQDLPQSPDVAVVLDIFPDHLDQHKSLREYYGSKTNIGRWQKKTDAIFYFSNNPNSKSIALKSPARKFPVMPQEDNLNKNKDMASAVAHYLKCPESIIEKTIKNFRGLEHRMELIKTRPYSNVLKKIKIRFINDSAATNPEATAAAIKTLMQATNDSRLTASQIILIAGGKAKNLDYQPLTQIIKLTPQVKAVILFGENKRKINKQLTANSLKLKTALVKDLKSAVGLAYKSAKKLINSSRPKRARLAQEAATHQCIILFSPASASYDMFKNYQERGLIFKKLVHSMR